MHVVCIRSIALGTGVLIYYLKSCIHEINGKVVIKLLVIPKVDRERAPCDICSPRPPIAVSRLAFAISVDSNSIPGTRHNDSGYAACIWIIVHPCAIVAHGNWRCCWDWSDGWSRIRI
jgi:hypothetical protein